MTQVEANTNSGKQKTRKNEKLNTPFEYKTLKIQFYSQIVKMKKNVQNIISLPRIFECDIIADFIYLFIGRIRAYKSVTMMRWGRND